MSHNQAVGQAHDEPQIDGLRPGAKLLRGQYEIIRYLSHGGFGVTYLARDSLERDVVIKECFPSALCRRNGDLVEPADTSYQEDLKSIVDLFIQEARNHARLVHPNIVDVHQVFEDNQTAYIAMDLIRGCDLLDYIENKENDAGPDFIVQVTEKMLSAVSFIHQSGMLHRDISPDNILIDENGDPVLIDFGAAREQAANKSAALLTLRVIKDGYSPHEFYVRGAEQGPSSDLYVLAATLYHAISGERPIDGQTRLNAFNNDQSDPYVPLTGRFEGYPDGFLQAIDKAMEVHATDRLQSALDWLRMFRGPGVEFDSFKYRPVSVIVALDRKDEAAERERIKAETENAEAVVTALLAGNSDIALGDEEKPGPEAAKFVQKEEPTVAVDTVVQSNSGGGIKIVVGLAAVAALAAGGFIFLNNSDGEIQTAAVQSTEVASTAVEEPAPQVAPITSEPVQDDTPAANEATETPAGTVAEEPVEQTTVETAANEAAKSENEVPVTEAAIEPAEEAVEIAETAEPVAPPQPAPVNVSENQVSFSHWDVDIPFATSLRRGSTGNVFAITSVDSNRDMSVIGDWVGRGAAIYTLNGKPVRNDATFAAQVLENLKVDPDGYTRVAARYRELGKTRAQNGLLALPAVRMFGLENGYSFSAKNTGNDGWQTVVTNVPASSAEGLQQGDVLLRESTTGQSVEGPKSLDEILTKLAGNNQPKANLTVLRNGAETAAVMQLAQE